MKTSTRRITLTSLLAALIIVFNALPLGLPPSLNPLPLRIPSTIATMIVSIIDPWAGALGALIGHFSYDYMYIGFGAVPALFGPWCFVAFGCLMRRRGHITWRRMLLGSALCIAWLTFTLAMGFWLLGVMPLAAAFGIILSSLTLTFAVSDIVLLPVLPYLRRYIQSSHVKPQEQTEKESNNSS